MSIFHLSPEISGKNFFDATGETCKRLIMFRCSNASLNDLIEWAWVLLNKFSIHLLLPQLNNCCDALTHPYKWHPEDRTIYLAVLPNPILLIICTVISTYYCLWCHWMSSVSHYHKDLCPLPLHWCLSQQYAQEKIAFSHAYSSLYHNCSYSYHWSSISF